MRYANPAALASTGHWEGDLIGRPLESVLESLRATSAPPQRLPGGDTAWYLLHESQVSLKDALFAAEIGDALTGTPSLRRTLARIVELAVPAVGARATVTLWDHDRLRRVSRGGVPGSDDRTVPLRQLSDSNRKTLRRMIDSGTTVSLVASPTELGAVLGEEAPDSPPAGDLYVAAAPLRAHGAAFGLLAVGSPGAEAIDLVGLEALARRGAAALSAARVYEERSTLAATLRSALLPPQLPTIEGIRVGAAYRAAQETTEIGGDFYELRPDGQGWSFTVGDVCGKGVEAAVLTGQVRHSLHAVALVDSDPVARLELLNSALLSTDGTTFVTAVHGVMRPVDGGVAVRVAAGGHPPPFLRRRDGRVEDVAARGPIIGMLPSVEFEPVDILLLSGETLVCYTDGLPDAKGSDGFLGTEGLAALVADSGGLSAQAIADRCLQSALDHLDGRPHDDMAVLAIQVGAG